VELYNNFGKLAMPIIHVSQGPSTRPIRDKGYHQDNGSYRDKGPGNVPGSNPSRSGATFY
jgi:hypothetical protein